MELLRKDIRESLMKEEARLTNSELCSYAQNDYESFLVTLFDEAIEIVKDFPNTKNLYYVDRVFEYIDFLSMNYQTDVDLILSKLKKLDNKVKYITKEKLKNNSKSKKRIKEFQDNINLLKKKLTTSVEEMENDFITYLLESPRDIRYIDVLFRNVPKIMDIKDENGTTLLNNTLEKYIEAKDKEEIDYYKDLLHVMITKDNYLKDPTDRGRVLNSLHVKIKDLPKKEREKQETLEELKRIINNKTKRTDVFTIADKYNIEINFDASIYEELKNTDFELKRNNSNRTRINDYIVSIDGESTIEIDDALSCKKLENGNFLLGVHIASVLGYFDYDSKIVQNAFNRVHSIYLKKNQDLESGLIPIFPIEFSGDEASLVEGKDRLTRSYLFEIDKKGTIKHLEFLKTIINNNKRATYEEVNEIIKNGSDNKELETTINNLKEVTEILSRKNKRDKLYELVKNESQDLSKLKVKQHGSEQIVYQSMLLTGNKVAEYFADNNYPCLYKTHKVLPDTNKTIQELIDSISSVYDDKKENKMFKLLSEIYPKSTYHKTGSHDGLGLDHYCHCTSGLRRAADILVEHCLEECYDKEPTKEEILNLENEIDNKSYLINSSEDKINWFVQETNKNYKKK